MKKRDRISAAIAGKPVDRVPVSAWGHFFLDETRAESFADRMLSFQEEYDWDFLKVHARASYHVEPFGWRYTASQSAAAGHQLAHTPIRHPEDWLKLRPVGLDADALQEQLTALQMMRDRLADDVPIIMTVFTPLDIAEKMLDRKPELLARHLQEAPEAIAHALAVFAETLNPFVARLVELGVEGVFFSTKWANAAKFSPTEYRDHCMAHELHMMKPAENLPFNIMHLCENEVFLDTFADYPVSILHWNDSGPHNPSLRAGHVIGGKAVAGGIDPAWLTKASPQEVEEKAVAAIRDMGGTGMILAPGCSLRVAATSGANLRALRGAPDLAGQGL